MGCFSQRFSKKVFRANFLFRVGALLSDPSTLAGTLAALFLGGGFVGTFLGVFATGLGAFVAVACWTVAALLALASVGMLLKGAYRNPGDRYLGVFCAGLGAFISVFLSIHFVANPSPGELAIYRDKAFIVERPARIVGLEPPASVNLIEEVEIRLPVTVVDRKLVALSLSDEDRTALFGGFTDVDGRNRKAKEILSRALGRQVARSAQSLSLEQALRRNGLAPSRAPSLGVSG